MRNVSGLLLMAGMAVVGGPQNSAQTAPVPKVSGNVAVEHAPQPVAAADTRSEKQKTLAIQTERLFDMATELKAEVDLTNKNILSLKVVQKAEEIEALAKGMRGQTKK